MSNNIPSSSFKERFKGRFVAIRHWHDLDDFWAVLKSKGEGWYAYAPGEDIPGEVLTQSELVNFVDELDQLLRREHQEEYCNIVYVDDKQNPDFIKIYDPNNLGSACSGSTAPPLPGWVFSRTQPEELVVEVVPMNRRRWWRDIFGVKAG